MRISDWSSDVCSSDLLAYFVVRQLTAAVGLNSVGGPAQTVRPLLAPMAEAAAERERSLSAADRERVRAMAAATDNVALFFGEDIFLAVASILLIKGFLEANGILVRDRKSTRLNSSH